MEKKQNELKLELPKIPLFPMVHKDKESILFLLGEINGIGFALKETNPCGNRIGELINEKCKAIDSIISKY